MKIVVLDGYAGNPGDLSWDELRQLGDLTIYDRTPFDRKTILERIGDAELVFTNKTPLSAAIFDACPNLKFVGILATGYNIVDIDAAKAHGQSRNLCQDGVTENVARTDLRFGNAAVTCI